MKKIYTYLLFISLVFFSSCSKDIFKSYSERIVGKWKLTNVQTYGSWWGGGSSRIAFTEGSFNFLPDGKLEYTNTKNELYKGSWKIVLRTVYNNPNNPNESSTLHELHLTAINFTTQDVLTEIYTDMYFSSSDHFKGMYDDGYNRYVTHFWK